MHMFDSGGGERDTLCCSVMLPVAKQGAGALIHLRKTSRLEC